MECQECQARPATLHFTQLKHGRKNEIHVCAECAKEAGYMTYPEEGYSLHNLLSGLFNFESSQIADQKKSPFEQPEDLKCAKCELSFTEFKRTGKFGCAECYRAFSDRLDPVLRRVHSGNTVHNGKIPKRKGGFLHKRKKIEAHQEKLKQLIKSEAFEEAAVVRDEIKSLKSETYESESGDKS